MENLDNKSEKPIDKDPKSIIKGYQPTDKLNPLTPPQNPKDNIPPPKKDTK